MSTFFHVADGDAAKSIAILRVFSETSRVKYDYKKKFMPRYSVYVNCISNDVK